MYKILKTYIPDNRDPAVQKKELIEYFQQEFFDRDNVYSISKAMQDKGVTAEKYAMYRQCAELNANDIKKSLANKVGTFKNDYSQMTYILAILKRYSEGSKPAEPPQKEPPVTPPPSKPEEKPSQMEELTADSQPPKVEEPERKLTYAQRQNLKHFPDGDIPVITEADLFG